MSFFGVFFLSFLPLDISFSFFFSFAFLHWIHLQFVCIYWFPYPFQIVYFILSFLFFSFLLIFFCLIHIRSHFVLLYLALIATIVSNFSCPFFYTHWGRVNQSELTTDTKKQKKNKCVHIFQCLQENLKHWNVINTNN